MTSLFNFFSLDSSFITTAVDYGPMSDLVVRGAVVGLAVFLSLFIVATLVLPSKSYKYLLRRTKKHAPWRIAEAKRWLAHFRATKSEYSPYQRFRYIRGTECFLFEEIIMRCFEERGYPIRRTKMTRDGGSDGFVMINESYIVVQTKRYSKRIAHADVIKLEQQVTVNRRYDKGLFVHTGVNSKPILERFRSSDTIELLSGVNQITSFLDGEEIRLFGVTLNPASCNKKVVTRKVVNVSSVNVGKQ